MVCLADGRLLAVHMERVKVEFSVQTVVSFRAAAVIPAQGK
jgi:hypothetical protein